MMNNLIKSINLQSKSTIVAGAIAASIGGYYVASQFDPSSSDQKFVTQESFNPSTLSSGSAAQQCKSQNLPSFINQSGVWPGENNEALLNTFRSISPPSIVVTAAGNQDPKPMASSTVKLSQEVGAIVVGSISPEGTRSDFSVQHEEVHILAPSDHYITSTDENGNYRRFSGTSGAAPLVTGSLAGFEWISGYHPTSEEAKVLLEKTAIPTLEANQQPRLNGVGMVNAYKLGMVGKKLKEACGTDVECFQRKIQEDETYELGSDEDKETLLSKVEEAFPQCSQTMCKSESSLECMNKEEIFNDLRKAAFLTPRDKDLWRAVGCVYEVNNLSRNAAGVMSIYRSLFGTESESYVDRSCSENTDCTYVPHCDHYADTGELTYTVANKDFHVNCHGKVLCEGDCRCDGSYEKIEGDVYQAVCRSSMCQEEHTEKTVASNDQQQQMETQEVQQMRVQEVLKEEQRKPTSGEGTGGAIQ